jgi:carboxyl-terminal processing protease
VCLAALSSFLFLSFASILPAKAQSDFLQAGHVQKSSVPPEVLYHQAWKLIKDSYYDQKFSGQDWGRWEHRYDGKLEDLDDSHKAIETMLASLGDPYTRFLNLDAFDDEKTQIEARLFGVGMQLGMKEHRIVVITPIEGTPAFKAGVHPS